jgi:hypothetical protein
MSLLLQRRLASATRVAENLVQQRRPWAGFSAKRVVVTGPRSCPLPLNLTLPAAPSLSLSPIPRHLRQGRPRSAAAPQGPFPRITGLPSRSALDAPPLRLAALRWREAFVLLG